MLDDRRGFLQQIGIGGGSLLASLAALQQSFADDLDEKQLDQLDGAEFAAMSREYMLAENVHYLNHASIGTIPRIVHQARQRYLEVCETNPHLYIWGGAWGKPRELVREKAAKLLGAGVDEIAFTHNTTETFNVLAQGLPLAAGDEVVFSSLNHPGASAPFAYQAKQRGYEVRRFNFPVQDVANMTKHDVVAIYEKHITAKTKLLVLPHVDNLLGIRHPVGEIAQMARDRGVKFIAVDGAQSVGMVPVHVKELGVDVLATSPHKWLQAPKGLGLAFIHRRLHEVLRPMWISSGGLGRRNSARQYENYGTRNLAEVLTLGDAIDFQSKLKPAGRDQRLRALWRHAQQLAKKNPRANWVSPKSWEMASSLFSVEFKGKNSNELAKSLYQKHGFVVRPLRVQGQELIRISPNVFTTEQQIDRFFELAAS